MTSSPIPPIHLLLHSPTALPAFTNAKAKYLPNLPTPTFTIHESSLSQLDASVKFDLIVSPANSSAILDGGFDDALSRAFSPQTDYLALTRHCQAHLHREYRGFQPPGTCTLIPIPQAWSPSDSNTIAAAADDDDDDDDETTKNKNVWSCRWLAHLPTMRVPSAVGWDREVVYECIWSLLCAVANHNAHATQTGDNADVIRSMMMTPLATGAGGVSEKRWAEQLCLAVGHFLGACGEEGEGEVRGEGDGDGKKVRVTWPMAYRRAQEVQATWRGEGRGEDLEG